MNDRGPAQPQRTPCVAEQFGIHSPTLYRHLNLMFLPQRDRPMYAGTTGFRDDAVSRKVAYPRFIDKSKC